jgi:hypothetical protein
MENIRNYFTGLLIILVPLFPLWDDLGQGQVYGFFSGAIIVLALSLVSNSKKITVSKPNIYLTLFILYSVCWFVYWLWLYFLKLVIPDVLLAGIDTLLFFVMAAIIYNAIIRSSWKVEQWFKFICISVLIQAGFAICQYFVTDPFGWILKHFVSVSYTEYTANTPAGSL